MAYVTGFSGPNTFVPSFEATGLVVGFIKSPEAFQINKYIGFREVKKSAGKYLQYRSNEGARIVTVQDYEWEDGSDGYSAVNGIHNEEFQFADYSTTRYKFEFSIGYKAEEQADWNILAAYAKTTAMKAKTHQVIRTASVLQTTGNWGANTDTATNVGGGKWNVATSTNPYIKATLMATAQAVSKATKGVVGPDKLMLVLNPVAATTVAKSAEIIDLLKQSQYSLPMLQGDNQFATWGIPSQLYGFKVIVDDTVTGTARKGATFTGGYAYADNSAIVVARPDAMEGIGSNPSFNTCTAFWYKDNFTIESKDDPDNRRHDARVVIDDVPVLTSPDSGYFIQAIV